MIRRILSALIGRKRQRTYYVDAERGVGLHLLRDDYQENLSISFFDRDSGQSVTVKIPPIYWPTIALRASQYAALYEIRQRQGRESTDRMAMANYPSA